MATSKLIAGFMGPLLAAIGAALLLNASAFSAMTRQIADNYAVVFLAGILALVAGVAVVRVHNMWSGGWPVIVTVLGWLAIVGGLARMWFPDLAAPIAASFGGDATMISVAGAVLLVLGGFLSFKAYVSQT